MFIVSIMAWTSHDRLISPSEPTQVTAEFSQHAIWVGSGHLGEAGQDENITVLQGALIHWLGRREEEILQILANPVKR